MALPVPNPKAMLANRRYDSDSFRPLCRHLFFAFAVCKADEEDASNLAILFFGYKFLDVSIDRKFRLPPQSTHQNSKITH